MTEDFWDRVIAEDSEQDVLSLVRSRLDTALAHMEGHEWAMHMELTSDLLRRFIEAKHGGEAA